MSVLINSERLSYYKPENTLSCEMSDLKDLGITRTPNYIEVVSARTGKSIHFEYVSAEHQHDDLQAWVYKVSNDYRDERINTLKLQIFND